MSDDVFPDRNMEKADKIAWVVETQGWCAEPVAAQEDPPTPGYTYQDQIPLDGAGRRAIVERLGRALGPAPTPRTTTTAKR